MHPPSLIEEKAASRHPWLRRHWDIHVRQGDGGDEVEAPFRGMQEYSAFSLKFQDIPCDNAPYDGNSDQHEHF